MSKCAKCGATGVRLYREYGCFLRAEDVTCNACVRAERLSPRKRRGLARRFLTGRRGARRIPSTRASGWVVPMVEALDGSVWGYTSAPAEDIARWQALPDKAPSPVWNRGEWMP